MYRLRVGHGNGALYGPRGEESVMVRIPQNTLKHFANPLTLDITVVVAVVEPL